MAIEMKDLDNLHKELFENNTKEKVSMQRARKIIGRISGRPSPRAIEYRLKILAQWDYIKEDSSDLGYLINKKYGKTEEDLVEEADEKADELLESAENPNETNGGE